MRKTSIKTLAAIITIAVCCATIGARSTEDRVIRLTARRFAFAPDQITIKKGEPVVLEINTEDVKHGFTLPDFGVRADIKPGAPTRVRLTPDKTGRFTFACDVFCGEGHEEMSGTLNVIE